MNKKLGKSFLYDSVIGIICVVLGVYGATEIANIFFRGEVFWPVFLAIIVVVYTWGICWLGNIKSSKKESGVGKNRDWVILVYRILAFVGAYICLVVNSLVGALITRLIQDKTGISIIKSLIACVPYGFFVYRFVQFANKIDEDANKI